MWGHYHIERPSQVRTKLNEQVAGNTSIKIVKILRGG